MTTPQKIFYTTTQLDKECIKLQDFKAFKALQTKLTKKIRKKVAKKLQKTR